MVLKRILWIFAFFLMFSVAYAVKPTQTLTEMGVPALTIESPAFDIIPLKTNFTFYWHLYNENGSSLINTTASCIFHLYENPTGKHIIQKAGKMDSNGVDWEVEINDSLFTEPNNYHYLIYCNRTTVGGFSLYSVKTGPQTFDPSSGEAISYSALFLILTLFFLISLISSFAINGENTFDMGENGSVVKINYGKYAKLFLFLLAYLLFWADLFIAWQIADKFLTLSIFTDILRIAFIVVGISIFPVLAVIIFISFMKFLTDSEVERLTRRGLRPR